MITKKDPDDVKSCLIRVRVTAEDIHDAYVYDANANTWSKHDYNN